MDNTLTQLIQALYNAHALLADERREKAALEKECERLKDQLAECDHTPVHFRAEKEA